MGTTDPQSNPLQAHGLRLAVLLARYNITIGEGLLRGACEELQNLGLKGEEFLVLRVPGAFELPFVAKELAMTGKYDALICLGAVIRGETSHYDYVCQGAAHGLMQAMLQTGVPMAFGVLTTENEGQARARSGNDQNNKGREAARTAVEMALLKRAI
jgi:6,7-dimethyl-8-ribityllumazine synthase